MKPNLFSHELSRLHRAQVVTSLSNRYESNTQNPATPRNTSTAALHFMLPASDFAEGLALPEAVVDPGAFTVIPVGVAVMLRFAGPSIVVTAATASTGVPGMRLHIKVPLSLGSAIKLDNCPGLSESGCVPFGGKLVPRYSDSGAPFSPSRMV